MSEEIIKLYEYFINREEVRGLVTGMAIAYGIVILIIIIMFIFILRMFMKTRKEFKNFDNRKW